MSSQTIRSTKGVMEELFRFIMTRPAQKAAAETPSVPVTPNTDYHGQLRRAKVEGLDAVRRVALAQASASSTVHSANDTKFGNAALKFATAAAKVDTPTLDSLKKLVKKHFDIGATELVADHNFRRDKEGLNDAVVTNVILAEDRTVPTDIAAAILRAFSIVERLAADDETIATKAGIDGALGSTLILPGDVFPLTRPGAQTQTASTPPPPPSRPKLEDLIAR